MVVETDDVPSTVPSSTAVSDKADAGRSLALVDALEAYLNEG
jgi:hypothetical protein